MYVWNVCILTVGIPFVHFNVLNSNKDVLVCSLYLQNIDHLGDSTSSANMMNVVFLKGFLQ